MPISLTCPGCQRKLAVPDNAAGKNVKCPKCQTTTRVPVQETDDTTVAVLEPEPAAVAAAHAPRPAQSEAVRSARKPQPAEDLEELAEAPRKPPRSAEQDDLEEDERRERARQQKKPITVGSIIMALLSAFIALLAYGGVGTACWFWTRLQDHKVDFESGQRWAQICVYSSCGLALLGFFLSLYSRGILRILAMLFGLSSVGAAAFGMLAMTEVISNPFLDFSKGRKSSASSTGLQLGETYVIKDHPQAWGFRDQVDLDAFVQLQNGNQGGGPGPGGPDGRGGPGPGDPGRGGPDGRGGPGPGDPGRGGPDGRGGPGPGDPGRGGPDGRGGSGDPGRGGRGPGGEGNDGRGGSGGQGSQMDPSKRQQMIEKKLQDLKARNKVVLLNAGQEVKLTELGARIKIHVEKGDHSGDDLYLVSDEPLGRKD